MRRTRRARRETENRSLKVAVYHNILWSKYKGVVFSELHKLSTEALSYSFIQIAFSEGNRASLSPVDLSYHTYLHELLNEKSYDDIGTPHLIKQLACHTWRNDADLTIIPGYHRPEYWAMLAVVKFRGRKAAVFSDSTEQDKRQNWMKGLMKRIFFTQCDGFFTYGVRSAAYLRAYGAPAARIFNRCQAAALPNDYSEADARMQRQAKRPAAADPRFLFVGRLSEEKGLETLIEAFAAYRTENRKGRLILCGAGPLEPALRDQVKAAQLETCTEFTGGLSADQLKEEYLNSTCLVLPSTSEPWGLVVNEALHYGCPVVVSDACGCVPELVIDGISGVVVPPSDPFALEAALHRIVHEFTSSETADRCFNTISPFSPVNAARQIATGCCSLLRFASTCSPANDSPSVRSDDAPP